MEQVGEVIGQLLTLLVLINVLLFEHRHHWYGIVSRKFGISNIYAVICLVFLTLYAKLGRAMKLGWKQF